MHTSTFLTRAIYGKKYRVLMIYEVLFIDFKDYIYILVINLYKKYIKT